MIDLINYNTKLDDELEKIRLMSLDSYKNFKKEDFSSPLNVISSVVRNDVQILGAGFLKVVPEAIIIINPDLTKRVRGEILDMLFKTAKMQAYKFGFDGIHAFTYNNTAFDDVLQKRFGFVDAGKAHYLEL